MPKIPKISELFVLSTSVAAVVHSVWTIGYVMSGNPPPTSDLWAFAGWLFSPVLISLSIDLGLLSVSHEIRNGKRSRGRYITFVVLSGAMFLLQAGYTFAHGAPIQIGAGVNDTWRPLATVLTGLYVWLLPLMLPLAITLHTFSSHSAPTPDPRVLSQPGGNSLTVVAPAENAKHASQITVTAPEAPALAKGDQMVDHALPNNREERRAALEAGMLSSTEETVTELDTMEAPAADTETDTQPKGKPNRPTKANGGRQLPLARKGNQRNGTGR